MNVCTIIAKNYVAQARVLARSFHEHHPGGRCFVLVVDQVGGYIDAANEPFEIVEAGEIGLDRETFLLMATIYDTLELATAVKPSLLAMLVRRLGEPVLYLDPDIQIFDSLEEVHRLGEAHRLVLTPHLTEPMPQDGRSPAEVQIMASGAYNLGFVAVAPGADADRLLVWWAARLRHDCIVDHPMGLFVDQRWFDMAPSLMDDFYILRDPGYNVAYWNLATRRLSIDAEGRYAAGGRPLRFFHFSGHDPDRPHIVSKHQNRHSLAEDPVLRGLFENYGALLRANGYEEAREWPYSYDDLPDGTKLTPWLRRIFRKGELAGKLERSAFTREGLKDFYHWLREPADPGGGFGVNQFLAELHFARKDLRAAYPDLSVPEHASGLVGWAHLHGAEEVPIPEALLPPLPSWLQDDPRLPPQHRGARTAAGVVRPPAVGRGPEELTPHRGVNVAGYLRSELGVAEAARLAIRALDAANVPLIPVHGSMVPRSRQGHAFAHVSPDAAPFPVNLICVNADLLPEFVRDAGRDFLDGRFQIGMWWWEVSAFPKQWLGSFDLLDEVWVATRHIADTLMPVSPIPVVRVPIPVSVPDPPKRSRAALGLPDGFVFLFVFDFHSVLERKNPHGLVEAFARAFPAGSGASLVLKAINGEHHPDERERLRVAVAEHPDVYLLEEYVSAADKNAMIASADCYVSLHRSEGLGLTLAEAMYLGKPVIATAYSGNLDFMTEHNSYLVPCAMRPIGAGNEPYPAEGEWADPDLDAAARLMRQVGADPGAAAERGQRAAHDIRQSHSPETVGAVMRKRLDLIYDRLTDRADGRSIDGVEEIRELVRAGPSSSPSLPRRMLQRGVGRALRYRAAHQRAVDERIVEAMEGVERAVRAEEARRGLSLARALAELRRQDDLIARLHPEAERHERELEQIRGHAAQVEDWMEKSDRLLATAERLVNESRARPNPALLPFETFEHARVGRVYGYRAMDSDDRGAGYAGFEDLFRGDEDVIRNRQRVYLELIGERGPVIDVGCGRGEFLDLLRERGVPSAGVDLDAGMVARCREKGHRDVEEADANAYLENVEDASIAAIFSAQVIEHFPLSALQRFLALSARKLRPEGVFIAETVNPHSAQALKAFWIDLTHQQPIFPEVALALCAAAGFGSAYVFHPNSTLDVDRDRFEAGDYAVVATDPTPMSTTQAGGTDSAEADGRDADRTLMGRGV